MMKLIICALLALSLINSEVITFDNEAVEKIFKNKEPALFLFFSDNEASVEARKTFDEFDQTKPDVLLTVSSKEDGSGLFERLAEYLGVDISAVPKILYMGSQSEKYQFDKEAITVETLTDFVARIKSGSVQQYLKSAPIPEDNGDAVKVVVGKNFKEIVIDSDKEVLAKFYAPWCGHCKTLAPHFEEAAKRLAVNDKILLIKVDSTENEVAGVNVQSFPTLKFWRKDKSLPPVQFNGERTADGIVQWIKEHTTYDWVDLPEAEQAREEL